MNILAPDFTQRPPRSPRVNFEALKDFLAQHQIRPIIDRTFAFDHAPAAFAHLQSAGHFGKLVIAIP